MTYHGGRKPPQTILGDLGLGIDRDQEGGLGEVKVGRNLEHPLLVSCARVVGGDNDHGGLVAGVGSGRERVHEMERKGLARHSGRV